MLVYKLVRDNVPDLIKKEYGKGYAYVTLPDDNTYREALTHNLLEEVRDLVDILRTNHHKKNSLINEIVDIREILKAIIVLEHLDMDNILVHQKEKRDKKGGYKKRIFLKEVIERGEKYGEGKSN
jgi:predicted house-cleaning noncanonical NTP pyrophosphatase (MazG superfamily)